MSTVAAPFPPLELMERVGGVSTSEEAARDVDALAAELGVPVEQARAAYWLVPGDPLATYDRLGRALCDELLQALPDGWSMEGKRVLDFGCGAGRTLRHLVTEAHTAEVWGCDIHRPSIEWLERNLSPPLHVLVNDRHPPLPFDDGSFDMIYVLSLFTHFVEEWSEWLLELHRLLADDGLLVATFTNQGLIHPLEAADWHESWDEDQVGMHVVNPHMPWDDFGPGVFHSMWWLRAHWGRAFEFVDLQPSGLGHCDRRFGQGIAVMRKRPVALSPIDLEALEPDEPREIAALRYSLRQSRSETAHHRERSRQTAARGAELSAKLEAERARSRRLRGKLKATRRRLKRSRRRLRSVRRQERRLRNSLSWRLTAPVRRLLSR